MRRAAPHAVADGALAPQRHLELVEVRRALRHVVALRARRLVRLLAAEDVGHEGVVADALLDLGHEELAELLRVLLHRHLEAQQVREDVHVARRPLADLEVREDLLQRAHDGLLGVASLCRRRPVQRVAERRVVVEHLDERAEVARRAEVAQPRRHIGPDVVVRVISQHREQALGLAPDGVRRVPDLLAQAVDAEAVRAAVLFRRFRGLVVFARAGFAGFEGLHRATPRFTEAASCGASCWVLLPRWALPLRLRCRLMRNKFLLYRCTFQAINRAGSRRAISAFQFSSM